MIYVFIIPWLVFPILVMVLSRHARHLLQRRLVWGEDERIRTKASPTTTYEEAIGPYLSVGGCWKAQTVGCAILAKVFKSNFFLATG